MQDPDRESSLQRFREVVAANPSDPAAHLAFGDALTDLARPNDAIECYARALALDEGHSRAMSQYARALLALRQWNHALQWFDRCLLLDPTLADAHRDRGRVLMELGRPDEAIRSFDRSLELDSGAVLTHFQRTTALVRLGQHAAAAKGFARLLEIAPEYPLAPGGLLWAKLMLCDWTGWAEMATRIIVSVNSGKPAVIPFTLLTVTDSPGRQLQCTTTYVRNYYPPAARSLWNGERYGHGRIRVAYLSADLGAHAVSALLVKVFETHDRERFEVIAVSLSPSEHTPIGRRVTAAFDTLIDASGMSSLEVATWIRQREIDIVVDLMGFTTGSRTDILAYRAAPIQLNYLGFPGTMGAPYIDYIIADRFVLPEGTRELYAEKAVRLPDCFQANDSDRFDDTDAPGRGDYSLPDSALVLCCFNNTFKLNPLCFDIWMGLLQSVPHSVLWLLASGAETQSNLRGAAARRGIDPERLLFAARVPYHQYLTRFKCADLFLDTFPFNGGTTVSDALWAGLPVLTCSGQSLASRMAGSLLSTLRLPELVTLDRQTYAATALELCTTPGLLQKLRNRLAQQRLTSPLFDTGRFSRHLESAYVSMYQRHARGEPPESFDVERIDG